MSLGLTEIIKADINSMIEDIDHSIQYRGNTVSCIVQQHSEGETFEMDGIVLEPQLSVISNIDNFSQRPKNNEVITYNSKEYRIRGIEPDPNNATIILRCEDKTK